MDFVLIIVAIIFIINLYLFLFGGLTGTMIIVFVAFLLGLLVDRLILKFEDYDDDEEDYDEYGEEDEYIE